ncbi:MAG TPA: histidine phosphatase family protein [bacterium]|nr:histidine phosphatase family protein [bacterium]
MRELILLRHAETVANERGILQGRTDYPLSARGVRQARALADVLVNLGLDAVYASPAGRVAATLAPAFERGFSLGARIPRPVIIDELEEIDLGTAACLTYDEFHAGFLSDIDLEVYRRGEYRFPGGESRRDLFERASAAAERIVGEGWTRALVAAHGGILSQFLASVLGVPFDGWVRFRLDNASFARVVWPDERPSLACFNDREHLPPELRSDPFPTLFPKG